MLAPGGAAIAMWAPVAAVLLRLPKAASMEEGLFADKATRSVRVCTFL